MFASKVEFQSISSFIQKIRAKKLNSESEKAIRLMKKEKFIKARSEVAKSKIATLTRIFAEKAEIRKLRQLKAQERLRKFQALQTRFQKGKQTFQKLKRFSGKKKRKRSTDGFRIEL